MKWYRFVSVVAMVLAVKASAARADIYRWDNGQVIPGTEGIEPGPGVQLDHMQLECAELGGWRPGDGLDLTGANLTGANLTCAILSYSTLTNANLTGAIVTGKCFFWHHMAWTSAATLLGHHIAWLHGGPALLDPELSRERP